MQLTVVVPVPVDAGCFRIDRQRPLTQASAIPIVGINSRALADLAMNTTQSIAESSAASPLWMRTQARNDVSTPLNYIKDTGLQGTYQAHPGRRCIAEQTFTSYLVLTPNYDDSRKDHSN